MMIVPSSQPHNTDQASLHPKDRRAKVHTHHTPTIDFPFSATMRFDYGHVFLRMEPGYDLPWRKVLP